MSTDRIHALRQALYCCRKGGTVSIPGVYGGFLDKLPFGAAFAKGLKPAAYEMFSTEQDSCTKVVLTP